MPQGGSSHCAPWVAVYWQSTVTKLNSPIAANLWVTHASSLSPDPYVWDWQSAVHAGFLSGPLCPLLPCSTCLLPTYSNFDLCRSVSHLVMFVCSRDWRWHFSCRLTSQADISLLPTKLLGGRNTVDFLTNTYILYKYIVYMYTIYTYIFPEGKYPLREKKNSK